MKKHSIYFAISIFTLAIGIFTVSVYRNISSLVKPQLDENAAVEKVKIKYCLIEGQEAKKFAIYFYLTPSRAGACDSDSHKLIDDTRRISVYKDFKSLKWSKYLYKVNVEDGRVIERVDLLDGGGLKIGEQATKIYLNDKKQITGASIFWIENGSFFAIQAPSIDLAKEFQQSKIVQQLRTGAKSVSDTK